MTNKGMVTTFVVIGAVFIGVAMSVQQANNPLLRRLVDQQAQVLEMQKGLSRAQQGGSPTGAGPAGSVEQRLMVLEKKIDYIAAALRSGQGAQGPAQPQAPSDEYTKVHEIPVGNSPVKGNPDAPITIVEFMDFQCPYCARFHPAIKEVMDAYPGQVKYVVKNFPLSFHQQAAGAAKAALAAGEQGKYFEMLDLLIEHFRELGEPKYLELAQQLGLDVEKFKQDMADPRWEDVIKEDVALAQKVDVRGTPTFYLNGRKTIARDLAAFRQEIDPLLKP